MTDGSHRETPTVAHSSTATRSRSAAAVLIATSSAPITTTDKSPSNSKSHVGIAIVGTTMMGTLVLTAPFVLQYIRSPLPYMATPKAKVRKALQFVALRKVKMATKNKTAVMISPNHHQQQVAHESISNYYNFVDLGSGDGEAVYQALQQTHPFVYQQATGIELNSTLWALSQLRRWLLWGGEKRKRSSFFCRDMFTFDVSSPARHPGVQDGPESGPIHCNTTVMIFGVKPLMTSISQKLARECVEGTHVLAYRFPLPLLEISDDNDDSNDSGNVGSRSNKTPAEAIAKDKQSNDMEDLLLAARLVYDVEEMRVYECLKQPRASID